MKGYWLTRYVKPYRAGEGTARENDLGPVAPAFVVTLEAGGRAIGDDETKDSTEPGSMIRSSFTNDTGM